ncbi:MAG: hypothetical protein MUF61_02835 [archaeon]|nr:hypothetical protein [archaeon]
MTDPCIFHRGEYNCIRCPEVGLYAKAAEGTAGHQHYQEACMGGAACTTRQALIKELQQQKSEELIRK